MEIWACVNRGDTKSLISYVIPSLAEIRSHIINGNGAMNSQDSINLITALRADLKS